VEDFFESSTSLAEMSDLSKQCRVSDRNFDVEEKTFKCMYIDKRLYKMFDEKNRK